MQSRIEQDLRAQVVPEARHEGLVEEKGLEHPLSPADQPPELGPAEEYRAALTRAAAKRRVALLGDRPERREKVRLATARKATAAPTTAGSQLFFSP